MQQAVDDLISKQSVTQLILSGETMSAMDIFSMWKKWTVSPIFVTMASAERSFSMLQLLENPFEILRSIISQGRLDTLPNLCIEKKLLVEIGY